MNNDVIVNLKAVQAESNWKLVAETACRHEAGANVLKTVGDSIFGWARRQATIVQAEVVAKLQAAGKEYNALAVRGAFENSKLVVEMEAFMRSPACAHNVGEGRLPRSWTQAKSDLCGALEHGLDLAADPEISQQKVKKFKQDAETKKKQEATQAALQEYAAAGGHIAEAPKAEPAKPAEPAAPAATPAQAPAQAPGEPVTGIDTVANHLTAEQLSRIQELINRLDTIAEANADRVDSLLQALDDQSMGALKKALVKLGRAA